VGNEVLTGKMVERGQHKIADSSVVTWLLACVATSVTNCIHRLHSGVWTDFTVSTCTSVDNKADLKRDEISDFVVTFFHWKLGL